ncbi:MAG: DUF3035 domain-containing protein [Pseudomonadota bacterium]
MKRRIIVCLILATALSACGSKDGGTQLTRLRDKGNGPNEFAVVPGKPLQEPESYRALPAPTLGGSNRTDATPFADSVAALGGNPGALALSQPSSRDGALLNHSRRYGVQPEIRQTLAVEDLEVRKRRGRVNILNLGQNDDYTLAYKSQWLDPRLEGERLRDNGIDTSSAPPIESKQR